MTAAFLPQLLDAASEPFRPSGRFAYHFARGKLGGDPTFRALLQRGILPSQGLLLDLGCGQGSLFAWLLAAQSLHASGQWPGDWPAPPSGLKMRGVDLVPSDVARAHKAWGAAHPTVAIEQGDMRETVLGQPDAVTILDVLHFISPHEQAQLLQRIYAALPPGGVFVTRVGDASAGWRFRMSQAVDQVASFLRGYRSPELYTRALSDWLELLRGMGFEVQADNMSEGQPYANVMLVCRVPLAARRAPGAVL